LVGLASGAIMCDEIRVLDAEGRLDDLRGELTPQINE
jgi:hypothetical protein